MYNRYIPEDTAYAPVQREPPRPHGPDPGPRRPQALRLPDFLGGKEGLSRLFKGSEGGGPYPAPCPGRPTRPADGRLPLRRLVKFENRDTTYGAPTGQPPPSMLQYR